MHGPLHGLLAPGLVGLGAVLLAAGCSLEPEAPLHPGVDYLIQGASAGTCLQPAGAATRADVEVELAACAASAAQWFRFTESGESHRIRNTASGLCLDARGGQVAPSAPVVQNPCSEAPSQRFSAHNDRGGVTLAGESGTLVLGVRDGGAGSPARIELQQPSGTEGQLFRIVRASGGSSSGSGGSSGGSGGSSGGSGGSSGSGGGSSGGASCSRPVGACSAPAVAVTDVRVGGAVAPYGQQGDTDPLPLAIAAMPSGGSRIAWLGTDRQVHVAQLDCDDRLVGSPFSLPGVDLQDLHADDDGGVVLLTRDATNGGTDQCGTGRLCGGSSSPCRTMWLVRFDASGKVAWETQVTNLGPDLAGHQDGARFVWWYQHHGRLAFDGTNYAAYFGVAITVNNGSCVDIHEGDRMQVVGPTGRLLAGHDSFEVGCSHAWQSRIVWDPRRSRFAMVCATDNDCRIAQPNPYRTIASATCDGTFFGGDLVNARGEGYWTAWSQGGAIRLQQFTASAIGKSVANAGSSSHPHLVTYGANGMLLAWGSGASMSAQIRDSATGETVGSPFTISVNDHAYQAFKAYPDGSVAYPASGNDGTSIRVARVLPCR